MERGFGGVKTVETSCQPVELHFCFLFPIPFTHLLQHHQQNKLSPLLWVPHPRKHPNPNPNLDQAVSSHPSPISTLGMLVNNFPLVNLFLVPWQGKLFSRGSFAVAFPFNFAYALASIAFVFFGEFN